MCLKLKTPKVNDKAQRAAQAEERKRLKDKRLRELTQMRGQQLGRRSLLTSTPGGSGSFVSTSHGSSGGGGTASRTTTTAGAGPRPGAN